MIARGDLARVVSRWWPGRAALLAALLVLASGPPAGAQIFFASRDSPTFAVGPVTLRAEITPALGVSRVSLFFGLEVPPSVSGADVEGDLFLLWPGAVEGETASGPPDPALREFLEARGFAVVREGRLPLFSRLLFGGRERPAPEPIATGAPFAVYVRDGVTLGPGTPGTWIRIPWTPRMVNRAYLMEVTLGLRDLVQTRRASWLENLLWGERHTVMLGFHDVRTRATFRLYLEHRDRWVKLADEPSQLTINFRDASHLKIHEVVPQSSRRRPSDAREHTEVVSLFLDASEGIKPQQLSVQFSYFTTWKAWAPVVFAALFFGLGNLAGPVFGALIRHYWPKLRGRVQFAPKSNAPIEKQTGAILTRDTLARVVPGETTREELERLCGPPNEEHESLLTPDRCSLVYRGRRVLPLRRRRFRWLATVHHWDVEHHEVTIELEDGHVRDVQARLRRTRLSEPAPAGG